MGTNYFLARNRASVLEPMHIGKSSAGWPFLFHAIDSGWENPFTEEPIQTFNQWKSAIEKAVGSGEAVILDEYDEIVSPEDFYAMVERKQKIENKDSFSHASSIDGYRFSHGWFR